MLRRSSTLALLIAVGIAFFSTITDAAKCRGRYMEMRGGDGFVTRGGCRGLDSQIQEEYWTTIGFDGALRDGRTTDDFMVFPQQDNNGHTQRNSFVAYWDMFENADEITRSKYGENVHYEAFGHAFIKPDGKVCGWFVGSEKEVVEVCGGFRVLSRSRFNPHQPIPFEWVQGEQYRNRDVLGFHHHKIAKYEVNGDEVLFGDADVKGKKFNGVSLANEERVQVDSPEVFHRKVWLLRKKSTQQPPQDSRIPSNIIAEPKRREDLDIYKDPYHEERIYNMRLYPYYDQYGRASNSQSDSHRPAYDSNGRRLPFDSSSQNSQNSQISNNYQHYDANQQPPRNHPGYEEWLRNQYRIRGIIPRGYNSDGSYNYDPNIYGNGGNEAQTNQFEPSYALQPSSEITENSGDNQNNQVFYEQPSDQNSGNSEDSGKTYYSVNPGAPVDASATQSRVDGGEFKQIRIPGGPDGQEGSSGSNGGQQDPHQHVKFVRYHPPTIIRDKKGNIYERRVENGRVQYVDASGNVVRTKIDDTAIDMKIEKILENRRREEEKMKNLLGNSEDDSDPISAAEMGRQG